MRIPEGRAWENHFFGIEFPIPKERTIYRDTWSFSEALRLLDGTERISCPDPTCPDESQDTWTPAQIFLFELQQKIPTDKILRSDFGRLLLLPTVGSRVDYVHGVDGIVFCSKHPSDPILQVDLTINGASKGVPAGKTRIPHHTQYKSGYINRRNVHLLRKDDFENPKSRNELIVQLARVCRTKIIQLNGAKRRRKGKEKP